MAEKKKLTTAEILAAARRQDGGGGPSSTPESSAKPAPAPEPEAAAGPVEAEASAEPAAHPPAASAKPAAKPGERPNVKDILAMARGGGATGAKPAGAAKADKPAPKPAAAKAPVEKKPAAPAKVAAAAAVSGAKDTASILAAARKGAKPGPMTKAEAATKPKPAPAKAKGESPGAKPREAPPMPVKPAYAKPAPAKQPADDTRRTFLAAMFGSFLGVGFFSLAAATGIWTLGGARFMFPNILTEPPSRFKVGFPANFAPGQVETKFVPQFGVWVVNFEYKGQSQIYALRTVCTHLGCTPNWLEAEQKFKCPCHGSGFYKDGINFEGPAPRPLERYAIRLSDDGQLEIDKSKLYQEEMGQWADPASFVAV